MASYRDFLPAVSSGDWVRPADWLPMPTVTDVEEKFVGLHGVWEDGDNVVAFLFRGAYTVDWGDGTVENFADNVKAEHQYDWASIPSNTTTSQGYRQVIITVTPQAGENLTQMRLAEVYTNRNANYSSGFLEIICSVPNATTGNSVLIGNSSGIRHNYLEYVNILTIGNATSVQNMFWYCTGLKSVSFFDTSNVNTFAAFFAFCSNLISIPNYDFSASTSGYNSAFIGCSTVKKIPNSINFSISTSNNSCFQNMTSLQYLPEILPTTTSSYNNFVNNCTGLKVIPPIDLSLATSLNGFAANCTSLVRCLAYNISVSISFLNCNLSAPAIVEIFNNLVDRSATTSATITITGNWGVTDLTASDLLIATNKNWVVVT